MRSNWRMCSSFLRTSHANRKPTQTHLYLHHGWRESFMGRHTLSKANDQQAWVTHVTISMNYYTDWCHSKYKCCSQHSGCKLIDRSYYSALCSKFHVLRFRHMKGIFTFWNLYTWQQFLRFEISTHDSNIYVLKLLHMKAIFTFWNFYTWKQFLRFEISTHKSNFYVMKVLHMKAIFTFCTKSWPKKSSHKLTLAIE